MNTSWKTSSASASGSRIPGSNTATDDEGLKLGGKSDEAARFILRAIYREPILPTGHVSLRSETDRVPLGPGVSSSMVFAARRYNTIAYTAGLGVAMHMLLTAEPIDARQVLEWNLVSKVVPHESLMDTAMA